MSNYSELLRNPQWQKKRLKIMERDDFSCVICRGGEGTDETLAVHHLYYQYGLKPWEYDDNTLVTLCEECHSWVPRASADIMWWILKTSELTMPLIDALRVMIDRHPEMTALTIHALHKVRSKSFAEGKEHAKQNIA